MTSTRCPASAARRSARMAPANPAPTTRTSKSLRTKRLMCASLGNSRPSHPAPAKQVGNGPQQDLHVAPQRPVGDVEVVDLHHLAERDAGRAEDLPVPRHSWGQL